MVIFDENGKVLCVCGCGNLTSGARYYREGKIYYPQYCHGHHKPRLGISKPAWNKGLTKEMCPILSKMGYQKGHQPYNDWSKVNQRLGKDSDFKEMWRNAKKGKIPWNKGLTKEKYPSGIATGQNHGNWKGNKRGIRDTALYADFRKTIFERDKYTCQSCGNINHKGNGKSIFLHVHHIVPISHDYTLIFEPSNVITLCKSCHRQTDTYGYKAVRKLSGE